MSKRHKPLVVGNWKMNPATLARAEKIWVDVQKALSGRRGLTEVAIAPPLPFISEIMQLSGPQKIDFVAQDVSYEEGGAFTGEVSVAMLRSIGVKCAIVGHSERRARGENDLDVNKKVQALIASKSAAIVCVGEKERDRSGDYFNQVEEQISKALSGVTPAEMKHVVLAYEPVWAIGTGQSAEGSDVQEMKLFIYKILADLYDRETAEKTRVLYGGSVNADNAASLLEAGTSDGFLVGGASLEAKQFAAIVKAADHYAKFA